MSTADSARRTRMVSSEHFRKTPSTPDEPNPSTMSLVRRNGTSSGVRRYRPCGCASLQLRIVGIHETRAPPYRLESNSEIDRDELALCCVDENIGDMPVSEPKDMPDH